STVRRPVGSPGESAGTSLVDGGTKCLTETSRAPVARTDQLGQFGPVNGAVFTECAGNNLDLVVAHLFHFRFLLRVQPGTATRRDRARTGSEPAQPTALRMFPALHPFADPFRPLLGRPFPFGFPLPGLVGRFEFT